MKTLLIVTGPQGSGNHLWSKIFAASGILYGWTALNETYWVPHDQEPFADAWHDPTKLKDIDIWPRSIAVTSISCPYAYRGETVEPNYREFINAAENLGYTVKVAIIGRDQTVLQYQQERVRRTHSLHRFERHLDYLCSLDPIFLSTELLYLYKQHYINKLAEILAEDPNVKYFQPAAEQPLDHYVRKVSGLNNTLTE